MSTFNYRSYSEVFQSIPKCSKEPLLLPARALSLQLKREEARVYKHLSRARRRGLPATLTVDEWIAIVNQYEWRCAFCDGPHESIEHIVPLHFGGGTTEDNCVPACIECNELRDWVFRGIAGLARARERDQLDVIADLLELEPVMIFGY